MPTKTFRWLEESAGRSADASSTGAGMDTSSDHTGGISTGVCRNLLILKDFAEPGSVRLKVVVKEAERRVEHIWH
jgi:hypothetical protein